MIIVGVILLLIFISTLVLLILSSDTVDPLGKIVAIILWIVIFIFSAIVTLIELFKIFQFLAEQYF